MKYYVILLVTYTDETPDKVAIYSYDDLNDALKNLYVYMGQYTNGSNVATVNVECKNNLGSQYGNLVWDRENLA